MACWLGFQLPIRNTRLVQSKFHSIHGHMASFPNGAIRFALLMNLANGMQYTRTRPVPSSYTIAVTCVQLVPSLSHSQSDRLSLSSLYYGQNVCSSQCGVNYSVCKCEFDILYYIFNIWWLGIKPVTVFTYLALKFDSPTYCSRYLVFANLLVMQSETNSGN